MVTKCSTNEKKKSFSDFESENLKARDHLRDLGIDGDNIYFK
jgi:hypothetical protein